MVVCWVGAGRDAGHLAVLDAGCSALLMGHDAQAHSRMSPCPDGVWVPQQQEEGRTVVHKGLTHFPLPIWAELSSPGAPSCPGAALLCSAPSPTSQADRAVLGLSAELGNPPREGPGKGALVGLGKGTTKRLSGSDVSFAFSPAEPCGFIKATKASASRYVDMHQCGSSLSCQVRKAAGLRRQRPSPGLNVKF